MNSLLSGIVLPDSRKNRERTLSSSWKNYDETDDVNTDFRNMSVTSYIVQHSRRKKFVAKINSVVIFRGYCILNL